MPSDLTPEPSESAEVVTFADLGLDKRILKTVAALGYETPSPIQAATIPVLLGGGDVVGLAQTGTGKTAAFALPILENLDIKAKTPQALILSPTRELAIQVAEAFESYAANLGDIHILPIYGGQSYGIQLSALRRGVHVVVGTPGRIMDHLDKGTLDLSDVKFVVLDEADEMLKMGFAEDVDTILASTPEDKQVALFSATMPAAIRKIATKHLRDAQEITVKGRTKTATNVHQRVLVVSQMRKLDALTRILEVENFDAMIIFARTKSETEQLADKLKARGFNAAAINGDMVQAVRERTINHLRDGKLDILVATDVAARGLDVERISHVVNFDIPTDPEAYVHRVGRTGRAGRAGEAISFATPRERRLQGMIEKATRQTMDVMQLPSIEDVNTSRVARFHEQIAEALGAEELNPLRELIVAYEAEHDVDAIDLAAALAVMAQQGRPLLMDEPPEPERPERGRREDRGDAERPQRAPRERAERGPRGENVSYATYRIEVGRRHKVDPRMIVGALANEGGFRREEMGKIDIRLDHSLVELPQHISAEALESLTTTRVSGRLIELSPASEKDLRAAAADREKRAGGRGGFQRDDDRPRGRFNRDGRSDGPRGGFGGGFQRDDNRGGRFNRDDSRGGGFQRDDNRGGRFQRDDRFARDDRRDDRYSRDGDDRPRGRFNRDDRTDDRGKGPRGRGSFDGTAKGSSRGGFGERRGFGGRTYRDDDGRGKKPRHKG